MKINKRQLNQIILQELNDILKEVTAGQLGGLPPYETNQPIEPEEEPELDQPLEPEEEDMNAADILQYALDPRNINTDDLERLVTSLTKILGNRKLRENLKRRRRCNQ